jgi:cytosine permease
VVSSVVEFAGGIASVAYRNNDLLEIMIGIGWKWEAFALIIAGSWILNAMNLYSAALSFEATMPRFESRACVGVLGLLGTLLAFANILDSFLTFLFYLSIAFAPVAGVITVDYIFVRRNTYENSVVADRRLAFRPLALLSWVTGAVSAVLSSNKVMSMTGIAALDALIVSAVSYHVMCRSVR